MNAIVTFLEGIGSGIEGFFRFVASLAGDIVYLVQLTGKMLVTMPSFLSWLPPQVSGLLITAITIAVLYKVLGRD